MAKISEQQIFEQLDKYCAQKPVYHNGTWCEFHGPFSKQGTPYPWTLMRVQLPLEQERRKFLVEANPSLSFDKEMIELEQNLTKGIFRAHKIQNLLYKNDVKNVIHFEPVDGSVFAHREAPGRPTFIFLNIPHQYRSVFTELRAKDLTVEKAITIAYQTMAVIQRLNIVGYIHRNISPTCIYRDEQGNINLGDFLFSAHINDPEAPAPCIDNAFIAPDVQAGGVGTSGSDMYSVALILYALFTHQEIAHRPNDNIPFPDGVPEEIQHAIKIGLTGNPARIRDFVAALRNIESQCDRQWPSPIISLFSDVDIEEEKRIEQQERELSSNGMALYPQYAQVTEYKSASVKAISKMQNITSLAIGIAVGFAVVALLTVFLMLRMGRTGVPSRQGPGVDPADAVSSTVQSSSPPRATDSTTDSSGNVEPVQHEGGGGESSTPQPQPKQQGTILTYSQLEGVPEDKYDTISELVDSGVLPLSMVGNYDEKLTRLDFAILAVNAYEAVVGTEIELDEDSEFPDVPGSDQQTYARKAIAANLMTSMSESAFAPAVRVDRETMAKALAVIHATRFGNQIEDSYVAPTITDNEDMSNWAFRYVQYTLGSNMMSVNEKGKFKAKGAVRKLTALLALYDAMTTDSEPQVSISGSTEPEEFALDAPTGMTASASGGSIELNWDSVQDADGYLIEYSTDPNGQNPKKLRSERNSITLDNLIKDTYYIRLRSYAEDKTSQGNSGRKQYKYSNWTTLTQINLT